MEDSLANLKAWFRRWEDWTQSLPWLDREAAGNPIQRWLLALAVAFVLFLILRLVLGDFMIVGDQMGTVEKVGLKTTRVRSISGEQLIFANTDLLQSRIRNFKRMQERRVVFNIGVTYETAREQVAAIPGMIRDAVQAQPQVRFDRSHFAKFGNSALDFETVYYVNVPDYNVYMDVQQAINLTLLERFAQSGIEFAYPTQTLFVNGLPGQVE